MSLLKTSFSEPGGVVSVAAAGGASPGSTPAVVGGGGGALVSKVFGSAMVKPGSNGALFVSGTVIVRVMVVTGGGPDAGRPE